MRKTLALIVAVVAARAVAAQARTPRTEPASVEELRGISLRGWRLAQFDEVAWHATDAVLAGRAPDTAVRHYIPRKTGDAWQVAFGHLSAARDTFLVSYEAQLSRGDSVFRVSALAPPRRDTGYFLRAARAIDVARAAFGSVDRPYNVAVIPADQNEWWVYLYPASTTGVWPLGADERFLISADGRTIRARRRMHKGIVEYTAPPDARIEVYTHAAILDDVPEDTDVFVVLTRTPKAPELIVTEAFVYRLDVDGGIACLGSRETVLGDHPPPK
ncbi:MAG: hypothetical protein NVS4B3_24450 [Gemmatimonadaceae bacterium]